jgi:acetylornithine/succinyldiaminopimelate/putrescine aminotransferase
MENSFHGRTLGTLSATGQAKYREGFGPLVPGFSYVPFGDAEAVRNAVDEETCAVMVEPIQGEGGVNVAPVEYFRELRRICDEAECLLIFDEVQTGVGRTGEWFGYQWLDVEPDVMTLAKALGGGVPIGAFVAASHVADVLQPGTHASTYGGNPLVCAAALAVLDTLEHERGLARAQKLQNIFMDKTQVLCETYDIIKEYRGAGTMFGIELTVPGQPVVDACLQKNVLVNCTHTTVLRFLTSVFLTEEEIDIAFGALEEALESVNAG